MSHRRPTPASMRLRGLDLSFGSRTFVMGILNVTPDSFSGDGLLRDGRLSPAMAVRHATRMVEEGADIIDVGGESTRPGHAPITVDEELERVTRIVSAIREALPRVPVSIDTSKPEVAEVAIAAGADVINDVTAVTAGAALAPVAASHGVPYVIMHGRERPEYSDVVAEVVSDLATALSRAEAAGCAPASLIVDPGIGFGKTPEQSLRVLRGLAALSELGRPILLVASRKSSIGRVLGLPPDERLEGTIATTALGIASGVDIVRVHDVAANVRAARLADAIIRGTWRDAAGTTPTSDTPA